MVVTVQTVMSREVFSCVFCAKKPELHGAKLRFMQFLCIAKRVIVYIMPLFGMV